MRDINGYTEQDLDLFCEGFGRVLDSIEEEGDYFESYHGDTSWHYFMALQRRLEAATRKAEQLEVGCIIWVETGMKAETDFSGSQEILCAELVGRGFLELAALLAKVYKLDMRSVDRYYNERFK